jgi:17beta-estradiol 17-dehydrogenase / very-long-chain 3-oxoacyl-CoA reductase
MIEIFGFILGITWIVEFFLTFMNYLKPVIFGRKLNVHQGTWAVITACTDGIGKGFAESLAKRGLNIVQVGRNPVKLSECARDLNLKYGVEVKNIVKDFSLCNSDPIFFFQDIYDQVAGLDVRVLVNNVGTNYFGTLTELKNEELGNQLSLNLFPVVFLTKVFEKDLMNKQDSWIINLSSVAAEFLLKGKIVYSAVKAFDLVFSEVLISEGKNVVPLQPAFVDTPLTSSRKVRPLMISPGQCSEAVLEKCGSAQATSGHWKHVIVILVIKVSRPLILLACMLGLVKSI